jgi:hemolysin activation/secretion protein
MQRTMLATVMAMLATAGHAQTRLPATNPVQSLPVAPQAPAAPTVRTTLVAPANPALQALLAHQLSPTRFELSGVKAVPFARAAEMFQPLVGKDSSVADILAAAERCTALYREHGYALSFCYVPAQDFSGGVVKVTAVEGYVADVAIDGDAGNLEGRLRAYARHVTKDRPLRRATFERYTQLMGQLPGITVTVDVPAPATTDGATRMTLKVTRKRVDVTASVDANHPGIQGLVSATFNGLTSLGEQLALSTLYPDGHGVQHYYSGALGLPLGSNGLGLRLDGSRYRGTPDTDESLPNGLEHRLHQDHLGVTLRNPVRLGNDHALVWSLGVYGTDQSDQYADTLNGTHLALQSKVRVGTAQLDWRDTRDGVSRVVTFAVAHGFDAAGATASIRSNVPGVDFGRPADVDFTRLNLEGSLAVPWPRGFGSVLAAAIQYSAQRLPSGEQAAFGGPRFGLAYDPGVTSGDSGWGASYEINRRFASHARWLNAWTPYLTTQYAHVRINGGPLPVTTLGTVAVGVRLTDGHHYNVDINIAQPVADRPPGDDRRSPRYNLAFSYSLR